MAILPICISVHDLNAWCPWSPEEGCGFPENDVPNICEQPCGCWEPMKEQPVLLTTKPSL